MSQPTNKDIYERLGEVLTRLGAVEVQTNKTNGRVNKLELNEAKREGKESVPVASKNDWKKVTFQLLAIIGTALTLSLLIAREIFK